MCLFIFHCSTPAKLNGHAQLDVPGLSQNEIQGLLLGSHQSQQAINVKREPEDLRIDPKCPRSQKVSKNELFSVFFFFFIASSVTHYLSPSPYNVNYVHFVLRNTAKNLFFRVFARKEKFFTSNLSLRWFFHCSITIFSLNCQYLDNNKFNDIEHDTHAL